MDRVRQLPGRLAPGPTRIGGRRAEAWIPAARATPGPAPAPLQRSAPLPPAITADTAAPT